VDDLAGRAFRRHYAQIYRYLRRRTRSDDEAEELAQAVFADAAERLESFRPGAAPVLAWLYTVAQRRLADRARRATRAPDSLASLDAARAQLVDVPEYGPGVARALRAAIAALPQQQRRVVVLKLLEGRSFADIAAQVGATEAACKMRFARGLEALRAELEREGLAP
jgi:RNA polymerase sigma-70 factor (ECF subfamily)